MASLNDGVSKLFPILRDLFDVLLIRDIGRLQLADRLSLREATMLRPHVLSRRCLNPAWSWQMAAETFFDALGEPRFWTKGPNQTSSGNAIHLDANDGPWMWLSGGTDWQSFQGCFRRISEDGVRPSWVSLRIRIATPEVSGAFFALCGNQHMLGFMDYILVLSFLGNDAARNRCFALQTDAVSHFHVGASNLLHLGSRLDDTSATSPHDIAMHLDWKNKRVALFVDGALHIQYVPFNASEPVRFASIYNWRSDAVTGFSGLTIGNHRPLEIDNCATVGEFEQMSKLQCPCRGRRNRPQIVFGLHALMPKPHNCVATVLVVGLMAVAAQLFIQP